MDREALWATAHRVTKESDMTEQLNNNRMGNTRDLFKKIRDTKGTFHAKMGSIKNRMVWT